MRVRLLGTGSADGWPNAFCSCASCRRARVAGEIRVPTAALVDGRVLLDCGPETPRAAVRHGEELAEVRLILITHDHPDHSAPMALLSRDWSTAEGPLTVAGPQSVLDHWRQWVAPDAPIDWRPAVPGEPFTVAGYRVLPLTANHGSTEAVLYDLTGPGGDRVLYATDTGPLAGDVVDRAGDTRYDLVLMEATYGDRSGPGAPTRGGHHDLRTFATDLARLRGNGGIDDGTRIVPVHLSHHTPADLAERLAAWGGELHSDGDELVLTGSEPRRGADDRPRRTLVLGGARSGKSSWAERLLSAEPEVRYVATGYPADAGDPEWQRRVEAHRSRRPGRWGSVDTLDLVGEIRSASGPLLIDCLALWTTRTLDEVGAWEDRDGWRTELAERCDALLEAWHAARHPVVAVSNEVGSGVVPDTASGRLFSDQLGRLNARIAAASERVVLMVAGRPIELTTDRTDYTGG